MTSITIFLGSALLFCLQPMVGRTLLPVFGGSAGVWSMCLGTFQVLLVGGYAYAHGVGGLGQSRQRRLHVVLLSLGVAWAFAMALGGIGLARNANTGGGYPALQVLWLVIAGVGVPYLLLSAGGTLLQAWVAGATREHGGRGVYRLYAISNLGSFIGLFAYPLLMEPFVSLRMQWLGWSALFLVYLFLVAGVAIRTRHQVVTVAQTPDLPNDGVHIHEADEASAQMNRELDELERNAVKLPAMLSRPVWWYVLPGLSSAMLVATTNHLSMDFTPVPLLWAFLLGAFLLSYVVGFSNVSERWMPVWRVLGLGALVACAMVAQRYVGGSGFAPNVGAGVALVFFTGVFLHGWLYSIRPESGKLTRFYLGIAVGGAIGGMAVSLGAPLVFKGIWEFPGIIILVAAAMLVFTVYQWGRMVLVRIMSMVTALGCMVAVFFAWAELRQEDSGVIWRARNFYGALHVAESGLAQKDALLRVTSLSNGGTMHGQQAHAEGGRFSDWATSYYGTLGGGFAMVMNPKWTGNAPEKIEAASLSSGDIPNGKPMHVGLVGLGIGTMARWSRPGDTWNFFEINPKVIEIAMDQHFFTYMSEAPGTIKTLLGDARLLLESERTIKAPRYDVLVIDAYTGDSVPLHLATEEAFQLYADRLNDDGVLAVHISNWHMDLLPLCKAAAKKIGMHPVGISSPADNSHLVSSALWVFFTRTPIEVSVKDSGALLVDFEKVRDMRLPTDSWGSLQGLISFDHDGPYIENEDGDGIITIE